jgi:hypothetical protein
MTAHHGNLSQTERTNSALLGLGLSIMALSRAPGTLRALSAVAAAGLLARAATGHCGVKSALTGKTTLAEGLRDQFSAVRPNGRIAAEGLPGSPRHRERSQAVDQSVEDSFPASDPPASRIPDEPPTNAQAKWDAARAAGKAPE